LTTEETTAHPIDGMNGKKIIQDVRNSIAATSNKSNKGFDVTSGIPTNEIKDLEAAARRSRRLIKAPNSK